MPRQVSPEFEAAADATRKFTVKPDQNDLLALYAHFKQAKQDPPFADAKKPGMMDFVGKAKYNAWKDISSESPEDAEKKYIELVEGFKLKYKYDENKAPE